jgi:hypothetical protein
MIFKHLISEVDCSDPSALCLICNPPENDPWKIPWEINPHSTIHSAIIVGFPMEIPWEIHIGNPWKSEPVIPGVPRKPLTQFTTEQARIESSNHPWRDGPTTCPSISYIYGWIDR